MSNQQAVEGLSPVCASDHLLSWLQKPCGQCMTVVVCIIKACAGCREKHIAPWTSMGLTQLGLDAAAMPCHDNSTNCLCAASHLSQKPHGTMRLCSKLACNLLGGWYHFQVSWCMAQRTNPHCIRLCNHRDQQRVCLESQRKPNISCV